MNNRYGIKEKFRDIKKRGLNKKTPLLLADTSSLNYIFFDINMSILRLRKTMNNYYNKNGNGRIKNGSGK